MRKARLAFLVMMTGKLYHIGNERAAVPLLFFSGHLPPIFSGAVPEGPIRLLNQPAALHLPVRKARAFTLIEVVISIFILMLLIMLAVPSVTGVMADRRLRHTLDSFNRLVYQAQERSIGEHRSYLLVWTKNSVELRPETTVKGDDPKPAGALPIDRGESFQPSFPSALIKDPPPEWIFWPSGACEPAEIKYTGRDGTWTATYSPLSARSQLSAYVPR
jgi:type II secretory pathway pseudopilin PulG